MKQEYVQVKTLSNPDGAYNRMKKAVKALIDLPNPPNGLKLHILKRPNSSSAELEVDLAAYINGPEINGRVQLVVDEFELAP